MISQSSANALFLETARLLELNGSIVENRRTGKIVKQLDYPIILCLTDPTNNIISITERKNNLFATIFETIWVLSGSRDIRPLEYFLPRANQFSDDGITWRAGYGFRLFSNCGNQLETARKILQSDITSRQAVCSIWDPALDPDPTSKDNPCSNLLYFSVKNGKLDLTLVVRSNDLIWGFSAINLFEFTTIQQIMAGMLNLPVGNYYHIVNNLHVYEHHFSLLNSLYFKTPNSFDILFSSYNLSNYYNYKPKSNLRLDNLTQYNWNTINNYYSEFVSIIYNSLSNNCPIPTSVYERDPNDYYSPFLIEFLTEILIDYIRGTIDLDKLLDCHYGFRSWYEQVYLQMDKPYKINLV